jgi:Zn-dependent protease
MPDTLTSIFNVIILIMSVVIHEVSHGYAALYFGDRTALMAGRLTLNPIKHIDPVGSIIVPVLLVIVQAPFPFGWARPVPYNERNLTNLRYGTIVVAAAGVVSNFLLAISFGLIIKIAALSGLASPSFYYISSIIVLVNISLGIFNLIPVPPLDGSRILFALLPVKMRHVQIFLERYALALVIFLMIILWQFDFISPLIRGLFMLITGIKI